MKNVNLTENEVILFLNAASGSLADRPDPGEQRDALVSLITRLHDGSHSRVDETAKNILEAISLSGN